MGRSTMDAMTFVLDDRVWTREERDALPPDGSRHELLDGALIVTPSPGIPHQRMVVGLSRLLLASCPADLEVFFGPLDVTLASDTVLVPDLLVVHRSQATGATLDGGPLLAIEVASSSTRIVDRNLKLPRFERAGCPRSGSSTRSTHRSLRGNCATGTTWRSPTSSVRRAGRQPCRSP